MFNDSKKSITNRKLLFWWGIPKKKFETRQATLPYDVVAIICAEVSRNTENKKMYTELMQS
jgi:hypothetical protein